jgi:hypothetical protein
VIAALHLDGWWSGRFNRTYTKTGRGQRRRK